MSCECASLALSAKRRASASRRVCAREPEEVDQSLRPGEESHSVGVSAMNGSRKLTSTKVRSESARNNNWLSPYHRQRMETVRSCLSITYSIGDTPRPTSDTKKPCFFLNIVHAETPPSRARHGSSPMAGAHLKHTSISSSLNISWDQGLDPFGAQKGLIGRRQRSHIHRVHA